MLPSRRQWLSFFSLLVLQTQNAFNDNAVKFLLLPLGTGLAAAFIEAGGQSTLGANYPYVLAALLILPYILFSPVSGWVADKFPKNRIILLAMVAQTVVFGLIAWAVQNQRLYLATFGYFLLALQSTLLSPAKNGVIKELVGSERLNFANGWLEMTLILGILGGMFAGGQWFDHELAAAGGDAWAAATGPIWILAALTLVPLALAATIEFTPALRPQARFRADLGWAHFTELKRLLPDRRLLLAALGVMAFWILGAGVQLLIIQVAGQATGGGAGMGSATSIMVACASGGIAAGSVIVALVGRKRVALELVPTGGVLMVAGSVALALMPPGGHAFHAALGLLGMFSAMFYVPLFAWFQETAPEEQRGRLIACSNLLNNIGMVGATLAQMTLNHLGVPIGLQFLLLGLLALGATLMTLPVLPPRFWRGLLLPLARFFYRMRVDGAQHMPREGGVLLVCNHVSYADAFILSAASPRPLRFLVHEIYYRRWWCQWFLDHFGAVPIASDRAKDALRKAAAALRQGEVVCIFAEGRLTPDGAIQPFLRGLEVIQHLAPSPLLPAALHGLWGSTLTHFGRGVFRRLPRVPGPRATVEFAAPMPPATTAAEAEAVVRALFDRIDARGGR
jgi:acyl-[acyl-carrier-protein]-phospholipid O-acyltransferase / long-chain-fatty-acid--[acyl-carrier-protein] ligase